jgi:hypothetical protein
MAAQDIVTLDTATPQLEVPGAADTYAAPRALAISPVALTGSATTPSLDITQTWNTSGAATGLRLSVTDTASAAGSNLLELRGGAAGTTSLFSVSKAGAVALSSNIVGAGSVSGYTYYITNNSANAGLLVRSDSAPTIALGSNDDVKLTRDAANTLAQRNGTNAQAFRIYNTFTDASNYERAKIAWESNVLRIGTEKLGTGTARALEFQTDGVTRLTIAANGVITSASAVTISQNLTCSNDLFVAGQFRTSGASILNLQTNGIARFSDSAGTDFNRLQFGGTGTSHPALKRSTTSLQARLADDSAFTNIQGKLTADVNAVAETPTATHTITIYDAAGTAYKVLCVAA